MRYENAVNKGDYDEKRNARETIKWFADLGSFYGNQPDLRIGELFKKHYESLKYSSITEKVFIENLSVGDESAIVKILQDEKFESKYLLMAKIKEFGSEESLRSIHEQSGGDAQIARLVAKETNDLDFKKEILKNTIDFIKKIEDPELRNKKLKDSCVKEMIEETVNAFVKSNYLDSLQELVCDNYIEAEDIMGVAHAVSSDKFLFAIAQEMKNEKSILSIFKFIADKDLFLEILSSNGTQFNNVDESIRARIVDSARDFSEALNAKPEIKQIDKLNLTDDKNIGTNKFVIGMPSDERRFYVAWSNADSHKYHKDIFKALESECNKIFPDSSRSGGYIDVKKKEGGIEAKLFMSSGDFGKYSKRILELFKNDIIKALSDNFKLEVQLTIEISS